VAKLKETTYLPGSSFQIYPKF